MLLSANRIAAFEPFITNPKDSFTASEIAKRYHLNQKSVYLFLEELKGILRYRTQGKNKLYYLNAENPELVTHFFCTIEHLRTIVFYKKHTDIKHIMAKIIPHIKGIAVIFGSYAKGLERSHSDLDLVIIGNYNDKVEDIAKNFGIEINIKRHRFKDDPLIREVIKGHIIVKGAERFVRQSLSGALKRIKESS